MRETLARLADRAVVELTQQHLLDPVRHWLLRRSTPLLLDAAWEHRDGRPLHVLLGRHGQSQANVKKGETAVMPDGSTYRSRGKILNGPGHDPLTQTGVDQAKCLNDHLRRRVEELGIRKLAVIAAPKERTVHTARLATADLDDILFTDGVATEDGVRQAPFLWERIAGLQGTMAFESDVAERFPWFRSELYRRYPNAESMYRTGQRIVLGFLEVLRHLPPEVDALLLIGSARSGGALDCWLQKGCFHVPTIAGADLPNGSVVERTFTNGRFIIH